MNILGLLGVLFIALKLLGLTVVAGWSWWLVLLPFYGGILIWLFIVVLGLLGVSLNALFGSRSKYRF